MVMEVISNYEVKRELVPTSGALLNPEVQKEILAVVAERLKPVQSNLLADADDAVNLHLICRRSCSRPPKS